MVANPTEPNGPPPAHSDLATRSGLVRVCIEHPDSRTCPDRIAWMRAQRAGMPM